LLLVERLDDVVILGQRLPQPEREDDLAIGEVTHDLASVPLVRRRPPFDARRSQRRGHFVQLSGGVLDDLERIPVAEVDRVRIHAAQLTRRAREKPATSYRVAVFEWRVSEATAATSSAGSIGFARCIWNPCRRAFVRSSDRACAVNAAAGTARTPAFADRRIRAIKSKPSRPGMPRSATTASGRLRPISSSAASA